MEIEGVEAAVHNHDVTDMTDIFLAMMKEKADAAAQAHANAQAQMEQIMFQSQLPPQ